MGRPTKIQKAALERLADYAYSLYWERSTTYDIPEEIVDALAAFGLKAKLVGDRLPEKLEVKEEE